MQTRYASHMCSRMVEPLLPFPVLFFNPGRRPMAMVLDLSSISQWVMTEGMLSASITAGSRGGGGGCGGRRPLESEVGAQALHKQSVDDVG